MKVKATSKYAELGIADSELGRIPKEGEEFEVTEERFKKLNKNSYGVAFVESVEVEKAVKATKTEKATKTKRKAHDL